MRLLAQLATHQLLTDPNAQPPLATDPFHIAPLRWARNAAAPRYQPRINSPHPRTIHIPNNTDKAYLLIPNAPAAPFYRLILGNGNYTPTGNLGVYLSKQGAYTLIQPGAIAIPTNTYTTTDFDPTQLYGGRTADPSIALIQVNADSTATAHELGDLLLLAGVDLDPILTSLVPTETNYDISLFAPLTENALAARTLRTRTYDIDLLLPRTHPAYPILTRIRDYNHLYLEFNNRYIPVALADYAQSPTGGMLYTLRLKLTATAPYAHDPARHIQTTTYTGGVVPYTLPGDAPTPVEIRIRITSAPPPSPIAVLAPSANTTVAFQPDAEGIWSIHDTGRIYHTPLTAPAALTDRTDTLLTGALPLTLPPGDGHLALEHDAAYNTRITHITLAAYPRYQPDGLL
jgi:hypothetical protein